VVLQGDKEAGSTNWHYISPANLRAVVTPEPADMAVTIITEYAAGGEASIYTTRRETARNRYQAAVDMQRRAMADWEYANDELTSAMLDMMLTGMDTTAIMDFINSVNRDKE
jgi:hypothetical protein